MDEQQEQTLQHARIILLFEPSMPCGTGGCTREATSGFVVYDPALHHWHLFPRCLECTEQARQEQAQVNASSVLENDIWPDA